MLVGYRAPPIAPARIVLVRPVAVPNPMKSLICVVALALAGCERRADAYLPGYAEADYVRIAAPIAGTLTRVYVNNGDQVMQGAPAFVLEHEAEAAERAEALAHVQVAEAQLADARKGKRPDEMAAAQAQLDEALAAQALSQADFTRQQTLLAARFISAAQLDAARSALARDSARVADMRAQLRVARLGARVDAIAAAEQQAQAARAQLAQAEWKLAQKAKTMPQAGAVVEVLYRAGELVPAGGAVINLLPPANIKARFFVPEGQLAMLAIGRAVDLRCDGCGAPIPATISFIAPFAEFTSPLIYSRENRARLVFMAEARPAPEQAARLHPGQALEIHWRSDGGNARHAH